MMVSFLMWNEPTLVCLAYVDVQNKLIHS